MEKKKKKREKKLREPESFGIERAFWKQTEKEKGKRKKERMRECESLLEGGGVGKRRGCGQNSVHVCGGIKYKRKKKKEKEKVTYGGKKKGKVLEITISKYYHNIFTINFK